jgi:hypothetical protein
MESLLSGPDQDTDVPITPHQQLASAMEMPSSIRMHQHGGRCHLHIEHGGEQPDRCIRDRPARAHRDQLDREAVDAGVIGTDLERDHDQPICRQDGRAPRRRGRSHLRCEVRWLGACCTRKRPGENLEQAGTKEHSDSSYECPPQDAGSCPVGINRR